MVRVVCNLAELLIVVTDINSDEEWDEDDQSQTEGAEECGGKSLRILCTLLFCTAKQISGYQDIKYSTVLMLISTEMTRFFLIVATGQNWYEIKRLVITGLGKESIELNV